MWDNFKYFMGISIHALREEGDGESGATTEIRLQFLSMPSARRATEFRCAPYGRALFLSTPSARRATIRTSRVLQCFHISIPALREEGDQAKGFCCPRS